MSVRIKPKKVKRIKYLRRRGYSLPEISRELNVAKSTVLRHIKGIEILPEFIPGWSIKRGGSRKRKEQREKLARKEMDTKIKDLDSKEMLLILSCLYWGEGEKRDFGISNTDPNMIKVFIRCMNDVFDLDRNRMRVSIRIYEDLDKEKCLDFWSEVTGVSKEEFLSVNILKGKKIGKLEYGMCRIRIIKGADFLKKIKAVNSIITELCVPIAQ